MSSRQADLSKTTRTASRRACTVYSTPMFVNAYLDRDLGVYLQDTWTIKRSDGQPRRAHRVLQRQDERDLRPGRAASSLRVTFPEENDLPNWNNDIAPRVSVAYDLFGTGKTALKASWSKYFATRTHALCLTLRAGRPGQRKPQLVRRRSDSRHLDAVGHPTTHRQRRHRPGQRDRSKRPGEFRATRARAVYDPDIKRASNVEFTAGVNHELMPRFAVGAFYYRRMFQNLTSADRIQITIARLHVVSDANAELRQRSDADGTNGSERDSHHLQSEPGQTCRYTARSVDRNGDNNSIYDGFETSFTARLPMRRHPLRRLDDRADGRQVLRQQRQPQRQSDRPPSSARSLANGGRFCDESQFDIPFRSDLKIAGSTPLWWGINFGAMAQTYPGTERVITWAPPASVVPQRTAHQHRDHHPVDTGHGLPATLQPARHQFPKELPRRQQGVHGAVRSRSTSPTAVRF